MNTIMNQTRYIAGVTCPACEDNLLKSNEAYNSYSRYCNAYICSSCGVKEALDKFFWRANALKRGFELNIKETK